MKKKKYLPLYYSWLKKGKIIDSGLCYSLPNGHEVMSIFNDNRFQGLWGYDGNQYMSYCLDDTEYKQIAYSFTPLRQNMVLLLACLNGEL